MNVRVRRAPALEPPYDQDHDQDHGHKTAAAVIPGAPMLPLRLQTRTRHPQHQHDRRHPRRPVTPRHPRHPHQPRGPERPPGPAGVPAMAPRGTTASPVSPGRAAAVRFLGICVEVLNGHRPAAHLRALTTAADLTRVTDQLVRRTTRTYLAGRGAPRPHRVRLRGMRICEPRDGIAELAAVLEFGPQTWAMAGRLERHADTWLCTVVQVV
jgi:hypothetical protein